MRNLITQITEDGRARLVLKNENEIIDLIECYKPDIWLTCEQFGVDTSRINENNTLLNGQKIETGEISFSELVETELLWQFRNA